MRIYVTCIYVLGLGLGILYQIGMTLTTSYFDKKRGIANGISSCGNAIGTLSFSPLAQLLIRAYGFKYGCLILSGFPALGILFGLLIVSPSKALQISNAISANSSTEEADTEGDCEGSEAVKIDVEKVVPQVNPDTNIQKSNTTMLNALNASFNLKLFRNPNYIIFLFSSVLLYLSYYVPYAFIPLRALHDGISKQESGFLITIAGISSGFSRVASGFIADLRLVRARRYYCYCVTLIACGITTLFSFGSNHICHAANAANYGALTGKGTSDHVWNCSYLVHMWSM